MAASHFSSLSVMHKQWLTNCHGEEVSRLLTGESIPKLPANVFRSHHYDTYYRRLSIVTESGWFHSKVRELQNLAGIGGLAYLREDSCTHEHKEVTKDDSGRIVYVETHGYTVLKFDWDEEISAIRDLEDWCRRHIEKAGDVLEVSGKWILPAIEAQFFTLDPSMEGLGDGNSPEFFFCTLHTIGELMRFAKCHKDMPDLWVLYQTLLRYGS